MATRKKLSQKTVSDIFATYADQKKIEQAVANAVSTRIVQMVEHEVGNSTALKAIIRGSMSSFVNGPEFQPILLSAIKQKIGKLKDLND